MKSQRVLNELSVPTTYGGADGDCGQLPDGRAWSIRGNQIDGELGSGRELVISMDLGRGEARLDIPGSEASQVELDSLAPWMEWLFASDGALERIVPGSNLRAAVPGIHGVIERAEFFQSQGDWYRGVNGGSIPLQWVQGEGEGGRHPLRREVPAGEVFRRHCYSLGMDFTLRRVDPALDTKRFVDWMNQPRVAEFWEEQGDAGKQRRYIESVLAEPHKDPMIAAFDGRPFAYFELYWAMEDRLGAYYDAQPYDRGLHLLVGNPEFLGRRFAHAWLECIFHFMFLDDDRTQRLVGEPRADNHSILKYIEHMPGWRKVKEFDFPHKRAALVMGERGAFFRGMAGGGRCD
ncbi:GNAT family N-acetyltransferase [Microbulbifer sp. YPW16]|uniref:GNAT family N-acetyltransferase n=1 Tax=Microbulbifer sp. YPW16 TaxID=2904242 RepID=UPI001E514F01|nr:GNAT family N-acetyltransferase [Microbulbifer sp. YPW16]UHQ56443.1 acetyltransferase [Microbulbifer sp. YPW16]